MMKGREAKAASSTDLLVCFPSRAHLTLMPKPICSPARPSAPNKRHPNSHHHRKRSISRGGGGGGGGGGGQASPFLWSKTKSMGTEISEPTSPKVTCAGQIKVRPKTTACRSWQSVMEEIEKIHNDKKQRKRFNWVESLGFKKEIMQFLTCLRSIRFDLRCFGSFPGTDITTEDEEDEDDEDEGYQETHVGMEAEKESDQEASRTVFSKWFMVLQEDQNNKEDKYDNNVRDEDDGSSVPPPNALLLMRCRSAPAKSWLKESEGGDDNNDDEEQGKEEEGARKGKEKEKEKEKGKAEMVIKKGQSLKSLMEEEKRKKENLVVMRYDPDIYNISSDIAKETWIVGSLRDSFSRSRSWKR